MHDTTPSGGHLHLYIQTLPGALVRATCPADDPEPAETLVGLLEFRMLPEVAAALAALAVQSEQREFVPADAPMLAEGDRRFALAVEPTDDGIRAVLSERRADGLAVPVSASAELRSDALRLLMLMLREPMIEDVEAVRAGLAASASAPQVDVRRTELDASSGVLTSVGISGALWRVQGIRSRTRSEALRAALSPQFTDAALKRIARQRPLRAAQAYVGSKHVPVGLTSGRGLRATWEVDGITVVVTLEPGERTEADAARSFAAELGARRRALPLGLPRARGARSAPVLVVHAWVEREPASRVTIVSVTEHPPTCREASCAADPGAAGALARTLELSAERDGLGVLERALTEREALRGAQAAGWSAVVPVTLTDGAQRYEFGCQIAEEPGADPTRRVHVFGRGQVGGVDVTLAAWGVDERAAVASFGALAREPVPTAGAALDAALRNLDAAHPDATVRTTQMLIRRDAGTAALRIVEPAIGFHLSTAIPVLSTAQASVGLARLLDLVVADGAEREFRQCDTVASWTRDTPQPLELAHGRLDCRLDVDDDAQFVVTATRRGWATTRIRVTGRDAESTLDRLFAGLATRRVESPHVLSHAFTHVEPDAWHRLRVVAVHLPDA